jgi:hypothetical protein
MRSSAKEQILRTVPTVDPRLFDFVKLMDVL